MRAENITILAITTFIAFLLGLLGAITISLDYFIIIFLIGLGVIIILWYGGIKFYADPEKDIELVSTVLPSTTIFMNKKIRLKWRIKNHTNKKIDTLSYIIRPMKDGRVLYTHDWNQRWSISIPPKTTKPKTWGFVLPIRYNIGKEGLGKYDLDSIVEYKKQNGEIGFIYDRESVNVVGFKP